MIEIRQWNKKIINSKFQSTLQTHVSSDGNQLQSYGQLFRHMHAWMLCSFKDPRLSVIRSAPPGREHTLGRSAGCGNRKITPCDAHQARIRIGVALSPYLNILIMDSHATRQVCSKLTLLLLLEASSPHNTSIRTRLNRPRVSHGRLSAWWHHSPVLFDGSQQGAFGMTDQLAFCRVVPTLIQLSRKGLI